MDILIVFIIAVLAISLTGAALRYGVAILGRLVFVMSFAAGLIARAIRRIIRLFRKADRPET